jgi:flagellar hook-length control protein FliK
MEVPAVLNLPLGKSASELSAGAPSPSGNGGFSQHFERNVDRLKGEQDNSSVDSLKTAEKPDLAATEGAGAVSKAPADHESLANEFTATVGGNDLPVTADIGALGEVDADALVNDETVPDLNVVSKDIVFDPLSQAKESSAHIASISAGNLAESKTRFNGKNSASEFFNLSTESLPLDQAGKAGMAEQVVDRLSGSSQDVALPVNVGKEVSSMKLPAGIEVGLNNATAAQQVPTAQALLDKPSIQLETPMSNPRWGQDFNQRVQWMVNQSMSGAQIRLNPQHMGPVEVRIQMQNEQATISFTAQHGATREAIDAALPRLREMFNEQNIDVVDVDVSKHSFAEQRDQQAANRQSGGGGVDSAADTEEKDRSIFDQADNRQQREYSGLFSDFA